MGRIMRRAALASILVLGVGAQRANALDLGSASPVPISVPGMALFEGSVVNLANGWGAANACIVWRSVGVVECFRTALAMAEHEAEILSGLGGSGTRPSGGWCSSPLRVYEHSSFGGRQLSFWDAGYWQNLPDWGFNDALSSFKAGSCYSYMAEHIWGGGGWYSGNTSPYNWTYYVGSSWNDRVSSFYQG